MKKIIVLSFAVSALFACSATLDQGAESVVISRSGPARDCKYIGDIASDSIWGAYNGQERANASLRNNAMKKGMNFVEILQTTDLQIKGAGYNCPR